MTAPTCSLSWTMAWMTLPQDGKGISGVLPSHHHTLTREFPLSPWAAQGASSNRGTVRTAMRIHILLLPSLNPRAACTPCELRALPGALKALTEGLHPDTSVSPHPLCDCPFPLSAGPAAQDTASAVPPLFQFTSSQGHICFLVQGNEHLDGAGENSPVPR